jgi:tetratricopeptide (TPR) repeat protein
MPYSTRPDGVDRLLQEVALDRPDAHELGRLRTRIQTRIAARRSLVSRALAIGLPLSASLAVALPMWRTLQHPLGIPPMQEASASTGRQDPEVSLPEAPALSATAAAPAPAVSGPAAPKQRRRVVSARPPIAARANTLADETQRLSTAISLMRKGANPAGALQEIDEYRRAYPEAHFASEARMLRIEALIALGYRHEALDELAPTEIPSLPRAEELWVVRGELLLELNRSREALDAFDSALRVARTDSLIERALSGRATAQRAIPR